MAINDKTALAKILRLSENAPDLNIKTITETDLKCFEDVMAEIYYIAKSQSEGETLNKESVLPISGVVKSVCSCDKGFSDVNDPEHICDNCGLPTT